MRKLKITELNRISAEEFKQAEKLPLVVIMLANQIIRGLLHFLHIQRIMIKICIQPPGRHAEPPV